MSVSCPRKDQHLNWWTMYSCCPPQCGWHRPVHGGLKRTKRGGGGEFSLSAQLVELGHQPSPAVRFSLLVLWSSYSNENLYHQLSSFQAFRLGLALALLVLLVLRTSDSDGNDTTSLQMASGGTSQL